MQYTPGKNIIGKHEHMNFTSIPLTIFLTLITMTTSAQNGLITIESQHSVNKTADRFEKAINDKGLKFFMRIDHTQNAKNADLTLRPTQVILFGNPVAGTALMKCGQSVAIDLPQKALFWEDEAGKSWISFNDPKYLKKRHDLNDCDPVLEKVSGLLSTLANAAAVKNVD